MVVCCLYLAAPHGFSHYFRDLIICCNPPNSTTEYHVSMWTLPTKFSLKSIVQRHPFGHSHEVNQFYFQMVCTKLLTSSLFLRKKMKKLISSCNNYRASLLMTITLTVSDEDISIIHNRCCAVVMQMA